MRRRIFEIRIWIDGLSLIHLREYDKYTNSMTNRTLNFVIKQIKSMKNVSLITLLYLSVCSQTTFAQGVTSYVEYSYDLAGNRNSRKILRLTDKPENPDSLAVDSLLRMQIAQSVQTGNVLLYPNPTKGQVTLKITDLNDDEFAEYTIYTLSGQKLKKGKTVHKSTMINFDTYSPGVYLLNVKFREKTEFWKIIKEY